MAQDSDSPILKIGAVVMYPPPNPKRDLAPPQGGSYGARDGVTTHHSPLTTHRILILQPIPKRAGEVPAFVLPRGSRQYQDADGQWHDARDEATGRAHAATLEPYARGLAREVEEEAGVTPEMLARARVVELGEMAFQSRTKGIYPIYWFVVALAQEDAAQLTDTVPADALSTRWASLPEIEAMAARGEFSAGYVPVIMRALASLAPHPKNAF